MQKIVFVVLAASLAFFVADACSPSPSGGGSTPASTTEGTTTAAARKRRDLRAVQEDYVVATVHTSFNFSSDSQNLENAESVAVKVRELIGSEKEAYGDVRQSLKNAEGKLAIVYALRGAQFCDVAAVIGFTSARGIPEIAKVDVDCNNDFLATFQNH